MDRARRGVVHRQSHSSGGRRYTLHLHHRESVARTTRAIAAPDGGQTIWVHPTRGAITRDGVALVYWTWPGGEPPVLLLHGIGNYGRYWDLFAEAVAGRMQLVAPDARGHGESGRPRDGYAPADFVADALAVLDAAGIERAIVVGHSMGGLHSIHLAAEH